MTEVKITPSTLGDAVELSVLMREEDRAEVAAAVGWDAEEATRRGLADSVECWTMRAEDDLLAMYGVVDLGGKIGLGWLLSADAVEENARAFWLACKRELPALLERWDVLYNAIDCRHAKALRWAEHLGFELFEPELYGALGIPFRPFIVRKEGVLCALQR